MSPAPVSSAAAASTSPAAATSPGVLFASARPVNPDEVLAQVVGSSNGGGRDDAPSAGDNVSPSLPRTGSKNVVVNHKTLLVLGDPYVGKTALLRRLFQAAASLAKPAAAAASSSSPPASAPAAGVTTSASLSLDPSRIVLPFEYGWMKIPDPRDSADTVSLQIWSLSNPAESSLLQLPLARSAPMSSSPSSSAHASGSMASASPSGAEAGATAAAAGRGLVILVVLDLSRPWLLEQSLLRWLDVIASLDALVSLSLDPSQIILLGTKSDLMAKVQGEYLAERRDSAHIRSGSSHSKNQEFFVLGEHMVDYLQYFFRKNALQVLPTPSSNRMNHGFAGGGSHPKMQASKPGSAAATPRPSASVVFVSANERRNFDVLERLLLHLFCGTPLDDSRNVMEYDAVYVRYGTDSMQSIQRIPIEGQHEVPFGDLVPPLLSSGDAHAPTAEPLDRSSSSSSSSSSSAAAAAAGSGSNGNGGHLSSMSLVPFQEFLRDQKRRQDGLLRKPISHGNPATAAGGSPMPFSATAAAVASHGPSSSKSPAQISSVGEAAAAAPTSMSGMSPASAAAGVAASPPSSSSTTEAVSSGQPQQNVGAQRENAEHKAARFFQSMRSRSSAHLKE